MTRKDHGRYGPPKSSTMHLHFIRPFQLDWKNLHVITLVVNWDFGFFTNDFFPDMKIDRRLGEKITVFLTSVTHPETFTVGLKNLLRSFEVADVILTRDDDFSDNVPASTSKILEGVSKALNNLLPVANNECRVRFVFDFANDIRENQTTNFVGALELLFQDIARKSVLGYKFTYDTVMFKESGGRIQHANYNATNEKYEVLRRLMNQRLIRFVKN